MKEYNPVLILIKKLVLAARNTVTLTISSTPLTVSTSTCTIAGDSTCV